MNPSQQLLLSTHPKGSKLAHPCEQLHYSHQLRNGVSLNVHQQRAEAGCASVGQAWPCKRKDLSFILKIYAKMAGTRICNPRIGETETGAPLRLTGQSTLTGKIQANKNPISKGMNSVLKMTSKTKIFLNTHTQ